MTRPDPLTNWRHGNKMSAISAMTHRTADTEVTWRRRREEAVWSSALNLLRRSSRAMAEGDREYDGECRGTSDVRGSVGAGSRFMIGEEVRSRVRGD